MKNLLTFLLCTLMTGISTAQFEQLFQLTSDDNNVTWDNYVTSISGDGQGNTYSAGRFENSITFGPFTLTSASGNGTGFLARFNTVSDSWVWANKITLVSYYAWSVIQDIASDASGNTYVVGYYAHTIKFDNISLSSTKLGSTPTTDLFVAKMNANGTWAWAKSFGTKTGADFGWTITLDANNNIYVGGEFANKVLQCNYWKTVFDIFLAKLNSSGSVQWQKRIAPKPVTCSTQTATKDITTDAAGNVYLTGTFSGTYVFGNGASLSITDNGSTDIYVAKFNSSGTTQWVRSSGGPEWDKVETIASDAVGNIYIAGQMGNSPLTRNGFVSKYNSAGTPIWTVNPFPYSAEFPQPWVVGIIPYGNSLLAADRRIGLKTLSLTDGSVLSSDSLTGNPTIFPDGFLASPFGISDLETDGTGFVVEINAECGTSDLGNITMIASTDCNEELHSQDVFVVRGGEPPVLYMQPDVDIKPDVSNVTALSELNLYPNPATNQVNIQLPEIKSESRLMICNHLGKIVWSEKMDEGKSLTIIHLSVEDFPQGVYFYSLIGDESITTKSFLISD